MCINDKSTQPPEQVKCLLIGGGKKVVRGDAAGRLGRFCKINAVIYNTVGDLMYKGCKIT